MFRRKTEGNLEEGKEERSLDLHICKKYVYAVLTAELFPKNITLKIEQPIWFQFGNKEAGSHIKS